MSYPRTDESEGGIILAIAPYRTRLYGSFRIMTTDPAKTGGQHIILVKGDIANYADVPCRVASSCVTSTALNAEDCDCAGQLEAALHVIDKRQRGILIYLEQEGRGNGLAIKIRAMNGKSNGLDTFEAVEELGFASDVREYWMVKAILDELQVKSVRLLTNNPEKIIAIEKTGVVIAGVSQCLAAKPPIGALRHLDAKRQHGHNI